MYSLSIDVEYDSDMGAYVSIQETGRVIVMSASTYEGALEEAASMGLDEGFLFDDD